MKRLLPVYFILPLVFLPVLTLLTGFFWSDPTWDEIHRILDDQYPGVVSIDVDDLKRELDKGSVPVLIDVREKKEFAVSQLPNAVNITSAGEVAYPQDTPLVVYCSVGIRSAAFAGELMARGFTKVRNLRGSIFAWANKDYPLQRGSLPVRSVHPYSRKWGTLLKEDMHMYDVPP